MPALADLVSRAKALHLRPSVGAHLVVLVLVSVLPVLVFASALVVEFMHQQRASTDRTLLGTARALALAVDRDLDVSISTLEALAASDDLDRDDVAGFYRLAERTRRSQRRWVAVFLARPSGEHLFSTSRPLGTPLLSLADREYFKAVVATGRPNVSDLLVGRVSGEPTVAVAVPVVRNGALRYIVGASFDLDDLAATLWKQGLAPNATGEIVDRRHTTLARSPEAFVGRPAGAEPAGAFERGTDGSFRSRTADGETVVAFSRSRVAGWTVVLARPAAVLDGPIRRTIFALATGGLALLVAGVAVALVVGRRIARPIRSLSSAAERLGRGEAPVLARAGVDEIETARRALVRADQLLRDGSEARDLAERTLRDREQQLRLITDSVPVLISYVDREHRYRFNNKAYSDWFGRPDDLVGLHVRDVLGEPAYEIVRGHLDRALEGEPVTYEAFLVLPAGASRHVRASYVPDRGPGGEVRGVVSLTTDVSDRVHAETALRGSEARFRTMANAAPAMLWVAARDGRRTFFNKSWLDFTGRTLEQELGDGWMDSLHPDDRAECRESHRAAVAGQRPSTLEYRARRADGHYRWVLDTGAPQLGPDGDFSGYVGSALDISERRHGEHQRAELLRREQTARAEAEVAVRRASFLADVSSVLASSLEYETTLTTVARLALPTLAEWVVIDVVGEDGTLRRLVVVHTDPAKSPLARDLQLRFPPGPDGPSTLLKVLRTRRSALVSILTEAELPHRARAPEHLRLLRGLGTRSLMVVPLLARGGILGAITLVRGATAVPYAPADLALAEDVARRAAVAIDNARLFVASDARRREAEALAAVGRALAQTLDPRIVWQRIADSVRSLVDDAPSSALYHPDPESGASVALAESSEPGLSFHWTERLPPGAGMVGIAMRDRRAVHAPDVLAFGGNVYPEEVRRRLEGAVHRAVLAVPLMVQERVIGALAVGARCGRTFTETETRLIEAFADQAAVALENTRLYEEAQRQRLEAETARAASEHANRAKDEFLAMLSHELRNPLAAIGIAARGLEAAGLAEDRAARLRQIIGRQTQHLARILEDLLDVARVTAGKIALRRRPTDLAEVVSRCVKSLADAGRLATHGVDVDSETAMVDGDPARLEQVLTNLLDNALKYTPAGGRIEVSVRREGVDVALSVRDTGVGMAPATLSQIFELFAQADRSLDRAQGGLGLGLTLVRRLVEMHGGSVTAASRGLGRGSEFTLRLPLLPSGVPAAEPRPLAPGGRSRRVLIVEDNQDTRESLRTLLELEGHAVQEASEGGEALRVAAHLDPEVVLIDIGLPGMDGYQVARSLRETPAGKRMLLVALTGYGRPEDLRRSRDAQFDAHLVKPPDAAELTRVVAGDPAGLRLAGSRTAASS